MIRLRKFGAHTASGITGSLPTLNKVIHKECYRKFVNICGHRTRNGQRSAPQLLICVRCIKCTICITLTLSWGLLIGRLVRLSHLMVVVVGDVAKTGVGRKVGIDTVVASLPTVHM